MGLKEQGAPGASSRRADESRLGYQPRRPVTVFATIAQAPPYKMTDTFSESPSLMTADISKWISGESEVFFDPRRTPPFVTADSNPGAERWTARPSIRKFVHRAIATVIGAVTFVASVFLVIPMRHSIEPLPTADAKSRPSDGGATSRPAVVPLPAKSQASDEGATYTIPRAVGNAGWSTPLTPRPTENIPTPAMPPLNQPTTTLSDAQVAAFLSEVANWYDRRTKATTVPERKPSSLQRASQ